MTSAAGRRDRPRAIAVFTGLSALAAFSAPFWAPEPGRVAGLLLMGGALAELLQGFRRRTPAAQRAAWTSAAVTLLLAVLILKSEWLASTAVALVVAVPFALDAARYAGVAVRQLLRGESPWRGAAEAAVNTLVAAGTVLMGRYFQGVVIEASSAGAQDDVIRANVSIAVSGQPVFDTSAPTLA